MSSIDREVVLKARDRNYTGWLDLEMYKQYVWSDPEWRQPKVGDVRYIDGRLYYLKKYDGFLRQNQWHVVKAVLP